MDWTEDVKLHKRYVEWREEVELELGSSLSVKSNSVKSNYVLRWAGKPARDYLKSLPQSEFKYEGASAESILQALEQKTKPMSNEIAAFTKLRSLKQEDMPLSEFIHEARRLAELCNYPNDKDRLIRDTIVSRIQSLRAYQRCINAKDLSLQDCINICQAEDAIRMQVLECRTESVKSMQNAQTAVPFHRLQNSFRQPSNSNRNKNKTACNCLLWGTELDQGTFKNIQCNASKKGLGAVLLQESKPVMYVSRALTETEQRYSNIERELLAIVFALERLNHYTFGRTITVQSDHQPLQSIWKKSIVYQSKTSKTIFKTGTLQPEHRVPQGKRECHC